MVQVGGPGALGARKRRCSGFRAGRVQGLGFRVQGLWFRVQDLGF